MVLKKYVYVLCVVSVTGLKVMFENFVQHNGYDYAIFDIRVRKFNRTITTLNGTVTLPIWLDNNTTFSLDLFHSRLGNQQFNHYPMKLPSCGTCDFLDNVQSSYGDHLGSLSNLPAIGECPFSPRDVHVIDFAFPEEAIPKVMPRGLWKALITGRKNGEEVISYYVLVKAYDDF
ncbi:uncharacterized protein LOC128712507 [Anopheles marshallii]|uniref:uncharacterized protein LOC128712507 n=1 Tax=Anopheles marshallii TaxID=1521116 RepID=UPI00237BD5E1|nr:uncharacterized protein LOC128712507 [Anopheles marshallii]